MPPEVRAMLKAVKGGAHGHPDSHPALAPIP